MEISGEGYTVVYDEANTTVFFRGVLRLQNVEQGQPLLELLNEVAAQNPDIIYSDFTEMQLMNSTGLSILTKFMFTMRDHETTKVILRAMKKHFWQTDLIRGLQRFLPGSELQWV